MPSAETKIATLANLPSYLALCDRGKIGVCTGCFDILQSGHAFFFEQCKEHCDTLIVVVGQGANVARLKPGRPINPDPNRLYLVAALEAVDFAILGDESYTQFKIDCVGVCELIQPDVYIVNDDDSGLEEKKAFCQMRNIEMVTVSRVVPEFLQPTSTTKIIDAIRQTSEEVQ